jgi:hypothetical protein
MGKPDSFANRDVEGIAVGILALAARRQPVAHDLRQFGALSLRSIRTQFDFFAKPDLRSY